MNEKQSEAVSSKVATLGAADLIPRVAASRSTARFSPRSKRTSNIDAKRLSRSPRRQMGLCSPRKTKRFQSSFTIGMKKNTPRSPNHAHLELSSNSDVSKPSSLTVDLPTSVTLESVERASQDNSCHLSSGQGSNTHSTDLIHLECSVMCVDIDNTHDTLISNEAAESADSETQSRIDDIAEDSGSDFKDDGTSSWHPSDDDEFSLGAGQHPRIRRKRSRSNANVSSVKRSQRKRKRLYYHSDSSAASSPSRETRRAKRTKELASATDAVSANGMASASGKNSPVSESDDYCWICHKVGQMVICGCCPRVYHPACLCMKQFPDTWLCPECQDLLVAECMLYQLPGWRDITPNQLRDMLLFLIDRLAMQEWAEHFREPVDPNVIEGYRDIVSYPMDLHTLYQRILDGAYASTQAFLSDFRWILHNCIIFNGFSSPLTSCARILDRNCTLELALMRACPSCYLRRMPAINVLSSTPNTLPPLTKGEWYKSTDMASQSDSVNPEESPSTLDPWWFCHLCDVLHPIVWVRLQRYPCWPAKVMTLDADNLLVSFFGDYDLTMAPIGSALLHSDSRAVRSYYTHAVNTTDEATRPPDSMASNPSPNVNTPPISPTSNALSMSSKGGGSRAAKSSSDPAVDANYRRALAELDCHMGKIRERYPDFKLPATQLEFTKRFYLRFQKSYGNRSTKQSVQPMSVEVPAPQPIVERAEPANPAPLTEESGKSITESVKSRDSVEPVLSTVARELFTPKDTTKPDPTASADRSTDAATITHISPASPNSPAFQSPGEGSLQIVLCDGDMPKPIKSQQEVNHMERPPSVLHPIPQMSPNDTDSTDEVRMLLDRMRSQFNEAFQNLETKLQLSRAANERKYSMAREPPTLSAQTIETEVQTESSAPPLKRYKSNRSVASTTVKPDLVEVSTTTKLTSSSAMLSPLQAVLMEGEIMRLERENQRLNMLLAFSRAELAFEMRHRIAELRKVWNFEVTAILEAASAIWEQDVIRIVDAVKRKQWCAYCGRVAFYYCCWNTCYCNSVCQAKHWASHITSCVQAKSQQLAMESNNATSHVGTPGISVSSATDKFERSQQQTMVHWPAIPGHSMSNSSAISTTVSTNRGQNILMRGKINP